MNTTKSPTTNETVTIRKKPEELTSAIFLKLSEILPENFHTFSDELRTLYTKGFVYKCLDLFVDNGYVKTTPKQKEAYGEAIFYFIKEKNLPKTLITQLGRNRDLLKRNIVLHEAGIFPQYVDKLWLFKEILRVNWPENEEDNVILMGLKLGYENES